MDSLSVLLLFARLLRFSRIRRGFRRLLFADDQLARLLVPADCTELQAVLAVAILKVFVWDLRFLEGLARIASFLILGGILVGVSLLYHRFRDVLMGD